jgi:HNH endonuclease
VLFATTYASVGKCIYCGANQWSRDDDRGLGNEHIIPEGLGGKLILPEASCRKCEKITGRVELTWQRDSWRPARVQKGLGRRKKVKAATQLLQVESGGQQEIRSIPLDKCPALVTTLCFDPPEILLDNKPIEKQLTGGVSLGTLPNFGVLLKPYLDQGPVSFVPQRKDATSTTLGRMLAKIGHSFAVAELGLDAFKPFLPSVILGTDLRYVAHYVGGTKIIPAASRNVYEIKLEEVRSKNLGRPYFMVSIRVLADIQGMPEYFVIVGEPFKT